MLKEKQVKKLLNMKSVLMVINPTENEGLLQAFRETQQDLHESWLCCLCSHVQGQKQQKK
jgi:hypothetical protein